MTSLVGQRAPLASPLSTIFRTLGLSYIEARPVVLWIFNLRFVVGGLLSAGSGLLVARALEGDVSWFLAVWVVYLVNGMSDINGDRKNGSSRPLASKALSQYAASIWIVVLAIASLSFAVLISVEFVLLVVLMLALGCVYSLGSRAAKRWGVPALAVAAAGGLLTYVAGADAFEATITLPALVFAGVMALWIAVVGHSKDFGDTAGDRAMGRRTLPIILGHRRSRVVVATGAIVIGTCAVLVSTISPVLISLAVLVPAAVVVSVLALGGSTHDRRRQRQPYQAFMVAQYGVNVLALTIAIATW